MAIKGPPPLPQSVVLEETADFEGSPSEVFKFYKILGTWQAAVTIKGIKVAEVSGFTLSNLRSG